MTKRAKDYIKDNLPYYKGITRKRRYSDEVKDKAWSILSDYVRCRDFLWFGTCVARGTRINDWRESDAGHYYSMSGHGTELGFSDMNVHMQSKNSNQLSSASDGAAYEKELIRRYGKSFMKELADMKNVSVKADDWYFIERIKDIAAKFQLLKVANESKIEFPDYI